MQASGGGGKISPNFSSFEKMKWNWDGQVLMIKIQIVIELKKAHVLNKLFFNFSTIN